MDAYALYAQNVLLPHGVEPAYVLVEDGVITSIEATRPEAPVRAEAAWLAPGFIDTHIHGFAGHDMMDCDPEGLLEASRALAYEGTTSWLPTTVTAATDTTKRACAACAQANALQEHNPNPGAHIAGIFLEGPFFAPEKAGAQEIAHMCDPSLTMLDSWQEAAAGLIVKSAVAPEREGVLDYIEGALKRDVVVVLGHTDASFAQAQAAVDAGASVFVHTYNAMSGLAHREPGVVGAAMVSEETYAELICDGVHVHPEAAHALVRAKGWSSIVLITDCLSCGGPLEGNTQPHVGEKPVTVRDGAAWMEDGHLGGSILTMAQAVKNVCAWGIASPEEALRAASEIPARAHRLKAGFIHPEYPADLVLLDQELNVVGSYVSGAQVR